MGRCGCGDGTCQCAVSGGDCIAVTGVGSAADPFELEAVISVDSGNLLECRDDGLYGPVLGAWTDWTPTYSNMTVGAGVTNYARYFRVGLGRLIHFELKWTFGAGSAISTVPTFTLPVASAARYTNNSNDVIGDVLMFDSGTTSFRGICIWRSSTTAGLLVCGAAGTYVNHADVTSTAPMTWTTSDSFTVKGWYEAAA